MCFFDMVKFVCGTIVVCLGVNVMGMNAGDAIREKARIRNKCGPSEMCMTESDDRACDRYDVEDGFELWKVDLFNFAEKAFQKKLYSSDEAQQNQAIDDMYAWIISTKNSELFFSSWGSKPENRKQALESLIEAKETAKKCNNTVLVEELESIIKNYHEIPLVFS